MLNAFCKFWVHIFSESTAAVLILVTTILDATEFKLNIWTNNTISKLTHTL